MTLNYSPLIGLFCLAVFQPLAQANEDLRRTRPLIWQMQGETNTVYLLGSIHMLRPEDHPLPAIYQTVYENAEQLVMEIDMDDLSMGEMASATITRATDGKGVSFTEAFTQAELQQLKQHVADHLLTLHSSSIFQEYEPWWLGMQLTQLQLSTLEFKSHLGVEMYFLGQAYRAKKPILGLETLGEQLDFFNDLSAAAQKEMVLSAAYDYAKAEQTLAEMVYAWKLGDEQALEAAALKEFEGFPDMYDALLVNRNRSWTPKIEAFLSNQDDYLVIVGAMHLVGKDSVVNMLRENGHQVTRL